MVKLMLLLYHFESMKSYRRRGKKRVPKSTCLNLSPTRMWVTSYMALDKFFLPFFPPSLSFHTWENKEGQLTVQISEN